VGRAFVKHKNAGAQLSGGRPKPAASFRAGPAEVAGKRKYGVPESGWTNESVLVAMAPAGAAFWPANTMVRPAGKTHLARLAATNLDVRRSKT